jgi:hexosaminidase
MKNPRKVEYMIFPRMSALSEVLWTPKDKKNWADFERRMSAQFQRYSLWDINYNKAYLQQKTSLTPSAVNGE